MHLAWEYSNMQISSFLAGVTLLWAPPPVVGSRRSRPGALLNKISPGRNMVFKSIPRAEEITKAKRIRRRWNQFVSALPPRRASDAFSSVTCAHPIQSGCTTRSTSSGTRRSRRAGSAGTCPPPATRNNLPGCWTGRKPRLTYRLSAGGTHHRAEYLVGFERERLKRHVLIHHKASESNRKEKKTESEHRAWERLYRPSIC